MRYVLRVLGAAGIAFAGTAMAQETVVRIAHVAPISGSQAHWGKDNENGVRMAIDDLNKQAISIGGKPVKWVLQPEDDAGDPKQGAAVAQKLCDSKVNGVVGHFNSGTTIPASRIYHDCGIPMITAGATNPGVTAPGYPEIFRVIPHDGAMAEALAAYVAQTLKLKTIAIIDDRTAYGQGLADLFERAVKAKGIQVADRQFTTDKATDFMAILTATKAKRPDAVFFGGMDAQGGPMLRQMEQLGMANMRFLGGEGVCTPKMSELAANAKTLGNVICTAGGPSIQKMPGGVAWKQRYDAAFPNQFQIYSPYNYDAMMVMAEAMKRANSTDPKVFVPKLKDVSHKGVTAQIEFDARHELKNPAITLAVFKDGKPVPMD
ncbi:branched-chain amino acid ABC transporter substrate-binding protein [Ottowia testudinis]|uniref:Branched-chain amino acid ABC transporter substrate-binding protein n=1 Tax=Ottowia testudinis TaxID=2816950 RepID=A0A975CIN3_9BURK|nr:branched-chain amino acid ABC transporter substrate-binding protein [Ottowia testudinis]